MAQPLVAIVGRANVGKSTLFNRLAGQRLAVVERMPGVTRDRNYAPCLWRGNRFTIIDTGGFTFEDTPLLKQVRQQVELAVAEADALLVLVDGQAGVTPQDEEIATRLRVVGKPVLLVVNKVDTGGHEPLVAEFFRLGLGEPLGVSAIHAHGVHDLLDRVLALLPEAAAPEPESATTVAIVGRPNVGKSSLVNALVGAPRSIVLAEPGTTRDVLDTRWRWRDHEFLLVDTAGLRRRARIGQALEYYSVVRSLRAISRAEVTALLLDGVEGPTHQDKEIAHYSHEEGRALVIAVNKWDLVQRSAHEAGGPRQEEIVLRNDYGLALQQEMDFVGYAPLIFLSALERQGLDDLMEAVVEAAAQHGARIATGVLNRYVQSVLGTHQLSYRGRQLRIYYVTQVGVHPPSFVFFVNHPRRVHFSHRRFLENQLRTTFGFVGTPIRVYFREAVGAAVKQP